MSRVRAIAGVVLTLLLLAGPAIAQKTTVYNYVEGKRSPLDALAHELFDKAYRVIDVSERERFVFPRGPVAILPKPVSVGGRCLAGAVTVLFIINAEGVIIAPTVAKTDNAILSQPALTALKEQRFLPAKVDGSPAAIVAVTNIDFKCPGDSKT